MHSLQDAKWKMHHAFFIMHIVFCLMKIANTQSKETRILSIYIYNNISKLQYLNNPISQSPYSNLSIFQ